jgi:pyridoxine/pyridoxamine 5'-phosphate oxidase
MNHLPSESQKNGYLSYTIMQASEKERQKEKTDKMSLLLYFHPRLRQIQCKQIQQNLLELCASDNYDGHNWPTA